VATSKPHTSQLQASPRKTTTPVANNRAPAQIPRYPRAFRTLLAEPLVRKLSNFETATTPPKINRYGAKPANTESDERSKLNHGDTGGTFALKLI
jgi:hypothetical protein